MIGAEDDPVEPADVAGSWYREVVVESGVVALEILDDAADDEWCCGDDVDDDEDDDDVIIVVALLLVVVAVVVVGGDGDVDITDWTTDVNILFQLILTRLRGGPIGGICWVARARNASFIRCGCVVTMFFQPTVSITSVA